MRILNAIGTAIAWCVVFLIMLVFGVCALVLMGLGLIGAEVSKLNARLLRWAIRTFPLLLALSLLGCGVAHSRGESFEWWTRYYEIRMALPPAKIVIIGLDVCAETALIAWTKEDHQTVWTLTTYYNPDRKNCRTPWKVALHEACHRRWLHHFPAVQKMLAEEGIDIEAEAEKCERHWKPRR